MAVMASLNLFAVTVSALLLFNAVTASNEGASRVSQSRSLLQTSETSVSRPAPLPATAAIKGYSPPHFTISAKYDGGWLEIVNASSLGDIRMKLKADPYTRLEETSFRARWDFRVTGARGQRVKVTILNANASYVYIPDIPDGGAWQKLYKARATYDNLRWFQVRTGYDNAPGHLVFEHTPQHDSVRYAYWPHYTVERMDLNVAKWQMDSRVKLRVIGQSLDGRDINLLQIGGRAPTKKHIWIVSGQHPGEDMHSAWTEGFVNRLLSSPVDAYARQLLEGAVLWVVPQINPDGIFRGHHRTNAKGYNLNRMWNQSSEATSPEVLVTQNAMYRYGVDMFMDIHGDELENYNLMLYPPTNFPSVQTNVTIAKFDQFLVESSGPAYSGIAYSYDPNEYGPPGPSSDSPNTADAWTSKYFKCLGVTVELPFTDLIDQVDWHTGWSIERSMSWGADMVQALARTLPWIRGDGPLAAPMYNGTFYPQDPAFDLQAKLKDPLAL